MRYQLTAELFKVPRTLLPPENPDNRTVRLLELIRTQFLAAYERSARIGSPGRLLAVIIAFALLIVLAVFGANRLVLAICATLVLLALAAFSARGGTPMEDRD